MRKPVNGTGHNLLKTRKSLCLILTWAYRAFSRYLQYITNKYQAFGFIFWSYTQLLANQYKKSHLDTKTTITTISISIITLPIPPSSSPSLALPATVINDRTASTSLFELSAAVANFHHRDYDHV